MEAPWRREEEGVEEGIPRNVPEVVEESVSSHRVKSLPTMGKSTFWRNHEVFQESETVCLSGSTWRPGFDWG